MQSNYTEGSVINKKDLVYTSPAIGFVKEIDLYINKPIIRDVNKGEALSLSFYEKIKHINEMGEKFLF